MGIGDELMCAGECKRQGNGSVRRFAIRDQRPRKAPWRWMDIWEGNPRIAKPGEAFDEWMDNPPRPYILAKAPGKWEWKPYQPEPAEIFLTAQDKLGMDAAAGKIIIQPTIKMGASPNKDWGFERWEELIALRPSLPWLQIGQGIEPRLKGVEFMPTRTFRNACAALGFAQAAVLQEGGLHHAAAAMGLKAVVIFGGFISPKVTGYKMHRNLYVRSRDHALGCGMREPCPHCHAAMAATRPSAVLQTLEEIL